MRCAVYFIPPREHPLCAAAASWLGRDPYTGEEVEAFLAGPGGAEHERLTAAPRRYGFHATIKAPFRLADGRSIGELSQQLAALAASLGGFDLRLVIARLGSFFALVPEPPVAALEAVAAGIVADLDYLRAPLSEADRKRRKLDQLSERQREYVETWGYPYVFDEFRFHMTLTGPVASEDQPRVERALISHFGAGPILVPFDQLAIAVEPHEGAPFHVQSVHRFRPAGEAEKQ